MARLSPDMFVRRRVESALRPFDNQATRGLAVKQHPRAFLFLHSNLEGATSESLTTESSFHPSALNQQKGASSAMEKA
jgi:hypothetical protein